MNLISMLELNGKYRLYQNDVLGRITLFSCENVIFANVLFTVQFLIIVDITGDRSLRTVFSFTQKLNFELPKTRVTNYRLNE